MDMHEYFTQIDQYENEQSIINAIDEYAQYCEIELIKDKIQKIKEEEGDYNG